MAENIDLRTELELLKQTALPVDEVIFSAKYDLYKTELSPDLLQEQLLMHLDNELEPSQMNLLAAEIAANNDLQREWNILQQTKLDPNEQIIFENKQSLYRHERDNVVTMRFWRVAAAVLLIGATLFIGITKFAATKKPDDVAVAAPGQQPAKKTNVPAEKNDLPVQAKEKNIASSQAAVKNKTTNEINNSYFELNISCPNLPHAKELDLEKLLEWDQNHHRHSYLRMTDICTVYSDGLHHY